MRIGLAISIGLVLGCSAMTHATPPESVVWTTPSTDARGSMPLGNGDISVNAWVDSQGDLLFYIGKSDSWEDNARLAKVGRVRVRLDPPLDAMSGAFEQRLDLSKGEMTVSAGADVNRRQLRLWVDANHPAIRVELESASPTAMTTSYELWRTTPTTLPSIEASDVLLDRSRPENQIAPTIVEPDSMLTAEDGEVGWFHHNLKSVGPAETVEFQDIRTRDWVDPILHRTFGAILRAPGAARSGDTALRSPPKTSHRLSLYVMTRHRTTPSDWLKEIRAVADEDEARPFEHSQADHRAWWQAFWDRSYIDITSTSRAEVAQEAKDVTRSYALQRYMTACAGRGAFPIKFNGSIFTVPWPGKPGDADYRRWGPGYWWQNTRLPYAPLCTSGDFDLLQPLFRMYGHDLLPLCRERTRRYFGFDDAAYLPEVMYFWGAVFADTYGRSTPARERTDKLQTSQWHKREWVGGLELAFMMLDYFEHTQDERFLRETLLPTALPVLRFFDRYYKPGPDGKLLLHPAQALETYWDATDPMPEVAGLHAVIDRLLKLTDEQLAASDRTWLIDLRARLPDLPIRQVEGRESLSPARAFEKPKRNVETPELYAVFPFRLVSFEKPSATLGIEALSRRLDKGPHGWRHEDIFMAYLGLAEEARDYVVQRARKSDPDCRFPAFWGPNYDWTPDQCHGGVLMKALQAMLLQSEGDRIFLLPAWPKEWDVKFRLHAPRNTVIEATVELGKVTRLRVTPESRRADVILGQGWSDASTKESPTTAPTKSDRVLRIMPVGDSITAGGGTFGNYRAPLLHKLREAGIDVEYVGSQVDSTGEVPLRHEGFGGKTAEYVASVFEEHFRATPADVVLIHAGHNHFVEEKPVAGIVRATEQMIADARRVNPRVTVLVAQVIPSGKLPKYSYIPELNAALKDMVNRVDSPVQRVVLVDQATGFNVVHDTVDDKVHPNRSGAEKMADAWFKTLRELPETK